MIQAIGAHVVVALSANLERLERARGLAFARGFVRRLACR